MRVSADTSDAALSGSEAQEIRTMATATMMQRVLRASARRVSGSQQSHFQQQQQHVAALVPAALQQQQTSRGFASGRSVDQVSTSSDGGDHEYDASDASFDASNRSDSSTRAGRKLQSSTKHFNLLAPAETSPDQNGTAAVLKDTNSNNRKRHTATGSAAKSSSPKQQPQEWRHRPTHYTAFRPNNNKKWWKEMDRVSFRTLLDECMAVGKVSSVLRKARMH